MVWPLVEEHFFAASHTIDLGFLRIHVAKQKVIAFAIYLQQIIFLGNQALRYQFKVIVTVFSSGCLQIGFGVLIIDYICNFLI